MPDPNVGHETATVWEALLTDSPTDNIWNSRAFFYSLAGGGQRGLKQGEGFAGRESSAGGRLFEFTVEYRKNTNFRAYGELDQLDLALVPIFDAARYDIKTAAGTIDWTDLEMAKAQEPNAKVDIIGAKVDNGKNSHIDDMNRQLLGVATASTNNVLSIKDIIADNPATPIVGGIDPNLWPFWRNKQTSGANGGGAAFSNLRPAMRSIYNQCSRGGLLEHPTAALFRRTEFEGYESTLIPQERFTTADKNRDGQGAFDNDVLRFKGAECFYDEDLDVASCYMYNPKYLKIVYLRGYWMKMSDQLEPTDQLTFTQKCRTHWQLCTDQRRRLGVVTGIN
jgi:hypothetical protein